MDRGLINDVHRYLHSLGCKVSAKYTRLDMYFFTMHNGESKWRYVVEANDIPPSKECIWSPNTFVGSPADESLALNYNGLAKCLLLTLRSASPPEVQFENSTMTLTPLASVDSDLLYNLLGVYPDSLGMVSRISITR